MPSRQQQFATLLQRPTIDEIVSSYTALLQKRRDALEHTGSIGPWTQKPNAVTRSCAPEFADLDDYDAARTHLALWYAPTPADPAFWTGAKKTVTDTAARAGFTTVTLSSDAPSYYQLALTDSFGAALSFGADKNVVLDLTTGCHLTAQAKTRGTPSAAPSR
ncbi:LppA family lipoprotein [Amycolatopsis sp. A133]|uniref:LppA family lipoprotein n=1 Tax=Amycolatopsis sp. A133 TaxID=3064472 RepID=UPI0027F1CD10|nr:LppA family lipoprotein [Amycolatopsis sp. A133]MDQ7809165.1 LppA family lipoprotein [Amycolatopsis sp. A133]